MCLVKILTLRVQFLNIRFFVIILDELKNWKSKLFEIFLLTEWFSFSCTYRLNSDAFFNYITKI